MRSLPRTLSYGCKMTILAAVVVVAGGCASAKKMERAEMAAPAPTTKTMMKEVVLDATELLEFDSAELSSAGMSTLDSLISQAGGEPAATISVTGHADRLGSVEYNMGLSTQRANAVADYLVSKGVPASSIAAMGKGESEPVVQCNDESSRKALIECLAPNRRVVVEYPVVIEEEVVIEN